MLEIKKRLTALDIGALVLALLLLVLAEISSLSSTNLVLVFVSVISAVSFTMLVGVKLSLALVSKFRMDNSRLLSIALTPLLGTGFIYLTWLTISTFSNLSPIVVFLIATLTILLPPKLNFATSIRLNGVIREIRKDMFSFALLIFQFVFMILVSNAFAVVGTPTWIQTIFDGLPVWVYGCIFLVFGISIAISLRDSKFWSISVVSMGIWIRTFMFSRGFVHFGGDDGENVAVVKMLSGGGIAPFLDLDASGNYWHWRYGSFETLNFDSNMAFISSITKLPPEFFTGVMSLTFSSLLLIVGGYALSSCILKNGKASRLSLVLILAFCTIAMWWQFRFDANLLITTLLPAYLAATILLPNSKVGLSLFAISSWLMFSTHPLAMAIVLPCVVYRILKVLKNPFRNYIIAGVKRHIKQFIIIGLLIIIVFVTILLTPTGVYSLLRIFSASHLVGLSPGETITIGNHISTSYFFASYYSQYNLLFLFLLFGMTFFVANWKLVKQNVTSRVKALLGISFFIFIEIVLFDFFLPSTNSFPAGRLWSTIPIMFAPMVASLFYLLSNQKAQKIGVIYKKLSNNISHRICFENVGFVLIFASILTVSFVQNAYPTPQSLNLDTLTIQECSLLNTFSSSVDLNNTLYVGEYPTMRYLSGIRGNWPATGNILSTQQVNAFISLAYDGRVSETINIAHSKNYTDAYAIVLNRYAGSKVSTWYGGRSYVNDLESFGSIVVQNAAGYILKLDLSDYQRASIPMVGWQINKLIGVTNSTMISSESMLSIGAYFPDRYQSISAKVDFQPINLHIFRFLTITYVGDGHAGSPLLRIFLVNSQNKSVEVKPSLASVDVSTNVTYDLQNLSIIDVKTILLSFDSGSTAMGWSGPDFYICNISNITMNSYQ